MTTSRPRQVTVSGSAWAVTTPDLLTLHTGASALEADATAAMAKVSGAMAAIGTVLDEYDVAPADRQTASLRFAPEWHWEEHSQTLAGYRVTQDLTARVRDIGRVGDLLGDLVGAAGETLQIRDLSWDLEDDTEIQDMLRRRAIDDARVRATSYAEAAGVRLGGVVSIAELGVAQMGAAQDGVVLARASKTMPIEQGNFQVSAEVAVTWELL